MSSAGKRDASASATAVFPDAVGPKSARTKPLLMPRLWCLASCQAADTRSVKSRRRFSKDDHFSVRPHELAGFVARGGFSIDLHAFRQEVSDREARVRVLGLGALEYALLAPATCIVAILLLLDHVQTPGTGVTMPWAIAVPVGGILALLALRLRDRLRGGSGWRDHLAQWLDSIHVIRQLFMKLEHFAGPLGTAIYWFGDIACLALCLRAYEGHFPAVAPLLVGYATGYALTRRTLPLAGAGAVEALLSFALLWTGTPLAAAVMAVLAYRIVNFWLPIVPAVFGLRALRGAGAGS